LCSFGAAGKGHAKLICNDAAIHLTMAIADNVLVDIKSVADVQALEIPPGEDKLRLVYTEDEDQVILRKCTKADSVINAPVLKSVFLAIYQNGLKNASYSCGTLIHTI